MVSSGCTVVQRARLAVMGVGRGGNNVRSSCSGRLIEQACRSSAGHRKLASRETDRSYIGRR